MDERDRIMGEAMVFWKSRVVLTGAELDVFTPLEGGGLTASDLARERGCDRRAMERLADALAALGLLEKKGDLFCLSPAGRLLSSTAPDTVLPMVLHFNELWRKWSRLTEVVRTGRPIERQGGEQGEVNRRAFIGAMHAISRRLSQETAAAFDGSPFRRLLDVGGGSGVYTIAFLGRNPAMTAVLFDVPPVIAMAREKIEAEGMADRVTLVAGDFLTDELPSGCDLALLSAVIHQNDPDTNVGLYRKVFRALDAGGSILIRDHVMDESRTRPEGGALFAVNMLVGTKGGDSYTLRQIEEGLEAAGFTGVRLLKEGDDMDSLVTARKPG